MLRIQPLNSKLFKDEVSDVSFLKERTIKKQYMGETFGNLSDIKITIGDRLRWLKRDIRGLFYDIKHTVHNYIKWATTIASLRPWAGCDGVLTLAQKHLQDYLETEEKYGHAEESYKENKIATVKECLEILERLQKDDYAYTLLREVESRYPKYQRLITEYDNSTCSSGNFIEQANGWAGIEDGSNPREGYFEFVNERFELVESPNQEETNRLLEEIRNNGNDIRNAFEQAKAEEENDKKRLGELLNSSFFTWWD